MQNQAVNGADAEKRDFWRDRPVLVTGATGLLGGWLVSRLVALGADVVCLVRDWVPQSILIGGDLLDRVRVARGDINDQECLERVLSEYEIDTVQHLAAQTIVGVGLKSPIGTHLAIYQEPSAFVRIGNEVMMPGSTSYCAIASPRCACSSPPSPSRSTCS